METTLSINASTCIKCGKCVRVCPSLILLQADAKAPIEVRNVKNCISCGHCVAICPTTSVVHSHFPADTIHAIDRAQLPTPDQMMLLIKARRSNRAFSTQPIPDVALEQILEAAHRAPTASNLQEVSFTLVTDPHKLSQITDYTIGIFARIVRKLENPILKPFLKMFMSGAYRYVPSFNRLTREREKGVDLILRGATAVILIHTPMTNRFGEMDANLAYQNASLMAESLGVSQFYTGFVRSAIAQDRDNKLAKMLGIKGTIHAGIALGMPSFYFPNYMDKKDIKVSKI